MKAILPLVILVMIAAVIISLSVQNQEGNTPRSERRDSPEGLVLVHREGLVALAYPTENGTCDKRAELPLQGARAVIACGDIIFVSTEDELLVFDRTFAQSTSRKFGKMGAIATDGQNVFVGADGSFIALSRDLQELDRVRLEFEGPVHPDKNAHDILIYGDTAYLLDNIMGPLYLFRADIKDPTNLQIQESIVFQGINAHLERQWLNPELNQWCVVQSFAHRGGSGKIVHIYRMDEGKEQTAAQAIFSQLRIPEKKEEGFDIKGATHSPPIWAAVQDVEEKYYLARVESTDNRLSFSDLFQLHFSDRHRDIILRRRDDYLFIAPKFGSLLYIISVEQHPTILLSKDLKEDHIEAIVDILPY